MYEAPSALGFRDCMKRTYEVGAGCCIQALQKVIFNLIIMLLLSLDVIKGCWNRPCTSVLHGMPCYRHSGGRCRR